MIDLPTLFNYIIPGLNLFDALIIFLLIFTRFLVMTLIMPIFGAQILPSLVRISLSLLLSVVCFSFLFDISESLTDASFLWLGLLFIKEALVGFIIGFSTSLIFFIYELFGELVDNARAANMSKILVPELKHPSSPMGTLFFQLALVLLFITGFHRELIKAAYESFTIFPPTSLTVDLTHEAFFSAAFKIMGTLFATAYRFAFPVIAISLIIDLCFGLINRVAPQINAYFLSLPAKMVGGLIMLSLALPFLLEDFLLHQEIASLVIKSLLGQNP